MGEVEETKTGLFLPSVARERPQLGYIVALTYESHFKYLDLVMFPKFHDRVVVIDNVELLTLREDELLALIEED